MNSSSTPKNDDFVREIARYHQEMIQAARRSAFREADERTTEQPKPMILNQETETERAQTEREREIESDLLPDVTAQNRPDPPISLSSPPSPDTSITPSDTPANEPPTAVPRDATGYLRVQTFTAREASPVPNAHITVYEETDNGDVLVTAVNTDQSGLSPVIPLPTVSAQLSQQPENFNPYVTYSTVTDAPGYYRVKNRRIPVFGGVVSNQPVFLVPLPEQGSNEELVYSQSEPNNLNR